jgi:hypothetical protein
MPIDPSIPLQVKNPQIDVGANQLAMMNEALKFNEANRSIEEQNQLNQYLKSGADLSSAEGRRGLVNYGKTGLAYGKALGEMEKTNLETKKVGLDVTAKDMEIQREKLGNLAFNPSDQNIQAHLQDSILEGKLTPQAAAQQWQQVAAMPPEQRKQYFTEMGVKTEERYKMAEQMRHNRTTEGIAGGHLTVAQQTLAAANNPELQAKLSAAKAGGTETGKATAQANIALPGAIATGEEAIRKVDELVGKAPVINAEGKLISAGTKPHAGFGQAVGAGIPGLKYIPGTSVTDFNKRLEEIQGGAFLQAFNTLKGGGSITEAEGTKATAAINRMSTAQSEKEFNIAAREYQDVLRTGIARAKAKAAGGGGVPVGRGGSAPAAGGEIDFNSLK